MFTYPVPNENQKEMLRKIGNYCAQTRMKKGLRQVDVAEKIGCSNQNLSAFERGLNNNAFILFWYVQNGLLDVLKAWGEI